MFKLIIAASLLAASALASASPARLITEYTEPFPALCFGYGRVNFMMPEGSDILAIEVDFVLPVTRSTVYRNQRKPRVTLHVAIDPDAPIVWRVIDITVGEQPLSHPVDRHLGFWPSKSGAVHAWDMRDFAQPVPGCGS